MNLLNIAKGNFHSWISPPTEIPSFLPPHSFRRRPCFYNAKNPKYRTRIEVQAYKFDPSLISLRDNLMIYRNNLYPTLHLTSYSAICIWFLKKSKTISKAINHSFLSNHSFINSKKSILVLNRVILRSHYKSFSLPGPFVDHFANIY
jgi:hypothetical protein